MNKTKIPWADYTWNPVRGCSFESDGCLNCYAKKMSKRFGWGWGVPQMFPEKLEEPFSLKKPSRIFVCSMSDLFHNDVPLWFIALVFKIMAASSQHTFIVLTKRPMRMQAYLATYPRWYTGGARAVGTTCEYWANWPLPNVWLGVTVEHQIAADKRVPLLIDTPAAVRFVSAEPLLEYVDLRQWLLTDYDKAAHDGQLIAPFGGWQHSKLDWVIAGPETGPGKRPCDVRWIEEMRQDADEWGAAFFDKSKSPIAEEMPR